MCVCVCVCVEGRQRGWTTYGSVNESERERDTVLVRKGKRRREGSVVGIENQRRTARWKTRSVLVDEFYRLFVCLFTRVF